MPFNRVIESLDIIQQLSDLPNEDDNLTADELKAKFDKGVNILKEYVFSFIDELEGPASADNIGYNGAHKTIGEALKALESAGVGTIPPDNTITTEKLQMGSVTEPKLAEELANKINATKVKFGTIIPTYTGDTTTDNGASGYVTVNKSQEHNIGFVPSAVLLFKCGQMNSSSIPLTSSVSSLRLLGLGIGQKIARDSSSFYRDEYTQYGGIAMINSPCMCNGVEVFKIDGDKIITNLYTYRNTDNNDADIYTIGTTETLYYLAIA
jgi:hypothetical protein